jgi:hypothetical protein
LPAIYTSIISLPILLYNQRRRRIWVIKYSVLLLEKKYFYQ